MANFEGFDVLAYLNDRCIDYKLGGKNVSYGWVGIACPFCGYDPSHHCGVNLEHKGFHCWICGEKGNLVRLIQTLEDDCTLAEAYRVINEFQED